MTGYSGSGWYGVYVDKFHGGSVEEIVREIVEVWPEVEALFGRDLNMFVERIVVAFLVHGQKYGIKRVMVRHVAYALARIAGADKVEMKMLYRRFGRTSWSVRKKIVYVLIDAGLLESSRRGVQYMTGVSTLAGVGNG